MNFGPKVREIRLNKGFSQKETYANIISKSYAIEFEKGKHSISTTLLIEVLDRLAMDIDEFLFINDSYHLSNYSDYIYKLSNYSNTHDLKSLKKMLQLFSNKNDRLSKIRFAEIRCHIHAIEHFNKTGMFAGFEVLAEDRKTIQEYLVQIETWTLREVQFFGNTIEFLDFETHFLLFKNLSKSLNLYIEYDKGREIFCVMLVNLIAQAIRCHYIDYAEVLIYQLKLLSSDYKNLFHQLLANYFENIIIMKSGRQASTVHEESQTILNLLKKNGHPFVADELAIMIEEFDTK